MSCMLRRFILDLHATFECHEVLFIIFNFSLILMEIFTFRPLPYNASKIYFWFSTIFLICRTFTMFLITASINDESVKPLAVFRTIPKYGWLPQVERLCSQVQQNRTALSGRNFFSLTRGMIMTIAGTIV